jgi:gamma-glutamyltranspeptidase
MLLRFFAFIVIGAAIMPAMAKTTTSQALAHKQAGTPVTADNWMISAANPLAVKASAHILRNGGTAADAMVSVQSVLGLFEPQSSGLGGGAFLVWYDGKIGTITTLDGSETALIAVTPQLFQDKTGAPLKFFDAVVGGFSPLFTLLHLHHNLVIPQLPLMQRLNQDWSVFDFC